jgi:hypothetical protein
LAPSSHKDRIDDKTLFCYVQNMKITVEFPDSEIKEICRVTGENKKGPAIRMLVRDALMLKRREMLAQKFISGEWGVELKGFEAGKEADKLADARDEQSWRG